MLAASAERISAQLPEDALVVDVGGGMDPLPRADWVIDRLPYDARHGERGGHGERFSAQTWVCRDVCDREPFPFDDSKVDFVVCSHTLEDVRDPIWVCQEINRIGKAGYIEVPSRLEEQSHWVQGPWVGWSHHHWLVDVLDNRIDFVFKSHALHGPPENSFPHTFEAALPAEDRVQQFWWTSSFDFRERIFENLRELDTYLAGFVAANYPGTRRPVPRRLIARLLHRFARR